MLCCIREGEERSPALRGRRNDSLGLRIVVHDFVHRRRAYSGLCGSSVRMFAINYVESVGVYRSTPPASNLLKANDLVTQEGNSVAYHRVPAMLRKEEAAPKTIAFYRCPAELFSKFRPKNLNEVTPEDTYAWRDQLVGPLKNRCFAKAGCSVRLSAS